MKFGPATWFRWMWPRLENRMAVVQDYAALKSHPHLATDILLRGYVFTAHRDTPDNLFEAGRREGRRELALEIVELFSLDPRKLWSFVEPPPAPPKGDA